ncbi:MAG: ABC transporter permease [Bacteroidota bacterium]
MIRPFERSLALRYLRGAQGRDERRGFLRFVVLAAIGGVAVGTGALLLALMIVRGFEREIEAKIVGFGQHVQVESFLGEPLSSSDSLRRVIEAFPDVERVAPAVIDFALLSAQSGSDVDGLLLWGTSPADLPFVSERTTRGTFSLGAATSGRPGVVIGSRLAQRLGMNIGDRVTAYSTRGLGSGEIQSKPRVAQYEVTGVFETGLGDFDDRFAFVSLDEARELFRYRDDQVSRLDITLVDPERARAMSDSIIDEIGPPLFARPISEVYRGLFAWVELQRSIVPLVISILVVVAAFNIVGALLMVVLEKAREIGTVLAMGASRAAVRRLFLVFGFLVGSIGALAGSGFALAFAALQSQLGVIRLPPDAYYLDRAPVEVAGLDILITVIASIVLCTLASYIPARTAASVEPIRTIRFGG